DALLRSVPARDAFLASWPMARVTAEARRPRKFLLTRPQSPGCLSCAVIAPRPARGGHNLYPSSVVHIIPSPRFKIRTRVHTLAAAPPPVDGRSSPPSPRA